MKKLSGYGIAFTGSGYFGFYKLKIKFVQPMKFVPEIHLAMRPKAFTALHVHFALDYFLRNLKQFIYLFIVLPLPDYLH